MTIEPYNPKWSSEFEGIAAILGRTLTGHYLTIEHVGSTSVPGLAAKPVLDIDIVITPGQPIETISAGLRKLGYLFRGDQGIPGRFAFKASVPFCPVSFPPRLSQKHHLYVCHADSLALKNHLTFKKALLTNPDLIKEYSGLKKALTDKKGISREEYGRLKTDFIISVLDGAGLKENELHEIREANR